MTHLDSVDNRLHMRDKNTEINLVTSPKLVYFMNRNPQCPVSRALRADKTKYSHSVSWTHYPARGNSFAKSQHSSSSLINDIFPPALGSGSV